MNKEKFIKELSKKLTILNEEERNDIINEYIDIIDEKVKHGKTEEEAVKDFGNINDLAKEIISTYKVDPNYRKNDTFTNVEKAISDGAKKLTELTNDIVDNVKSSETTTSLENVFELVIKLFLVFLSFAILSIPFYMISSLGESLLSSSGMFGFGVLGGIWKIVAHIMYYVVCILIVVGFIRSYTKKENKEKNTKSNIKIKEETNKSEAKPNKDKKGKKDNRKTSSSGEIVSTLILLVVKIWICILFLFPLWMLIIGMAIALSVVIYFIIKGVEIYGILILLIGAIGFGSYLSKIIFDGLFKSKKISFYPFIISIIILLIGGFMTFDYFADFTFYDSVPKNYELKTSTYTKNIDSKTYIMNADHYEIDNTLKDNQVKIEVAYYPEFMKLGSIDMDTDCGFDEQQKCLIVEHDSYERKEFNFNHMVNERVIEMLKTKKVYNYRDLTTLDITVYTNEKTEDLVK